MSTSFRTLQAHRPGGSPGPELVGAPAFTAGAACASVDPELFFPESRIGLRTAKRICAGCPVKVECLEYAIAHTETPYGVWGGLASHEIMRLRQPGLRIA